MLDDGAPIQGDKTTAIVEIDQLFNALDAKTRKGLQQASSRARPTGTTARSRRPTRRRRRSRRPWRSSIGGRRRDHERQRDLRAVPRQDGRRDRARSPTTARSSPTWSPTRARRRRRWRPTPSSLERCAARGPAGAGERQRRVRRAAPRARRPAQADRRLGPGDQGPRAVPQAADARCCSSPTPTFAKLRKMFAQPGARPTTCSTRCAICRRSPSPPTGRSRAGSSR